MNRKIRLLVSTEIPRIDDVDTGSIERELNIYIKTLASRINIQDLCDWKLLFLVNLRATNGIGFFKRTRRYPSNKEFEASISIPIPDDDQASYGLVKTKEGFYYPLNKNFYIL